ncbi:MAG: hypothetical protein ACFB5Z_16425 [Elainellaceae cyanobacterium]
MSDSQPIDLARTIDWAAVKRLLVVALDSADGIDIASIQSALPHVAVSGITVQQGRAESAIADWCFNSSSYTAAELIPQLQRHSFDAAIVLAAPNKSPYVAGYLCYLAGIPIRIGQSREFGGGVLSLTLPPTDDPLDPQHHRDQPHPLLQQLAVL